MALEFNTHFLHEIIWGSAANISEDVFKRWCQGFEFSDIDLVALRQYNGGPCSILASVQAHIFRFLFFDHVDEESDAHIVLFQVLKEMLLLVSKRSRFVIAYVDENVDAVAGGLSVEREVSFSYFVEKLRYTAIDSEDDLEALLLSVQPILSSNYGVICFLYSVVLTYGLEELRSAMSDEAVCLIDPMHGHSSQCLTNLLITGRASPYLFDNDKDLGGYVLSGISSQPKIGFLTIMEYLRYCEVGWNLKNPQYPIWVLASETHLTVLCSRDRNVIEMDNSALKRAEQAFARVDSGAQGFIMPEQLEEFLALVHVPADDPRFLEKLADDVDPEKLGLYLKSNVLRHLYPDEVDRFEVSYKFPVIHYNGLPGSGKGREVQYSVGEACVEDFSTQSKDYSANDSQLLKCLRTKWPTITLRWDERVSEEPSMN